MEIANPSPYGLGAKRSENILQLRNFQALTMRNLPDTMPTEYDLRKYLMPVRNQGSKPTCVAQVFACITEFQHMRTDAEFQYNSPMFVYNLRSGEGDGMVGSDLGRIGENFGICSESAFPYLDKNYKVTPPEEAREEASRHKTKSMVVLDTIINVKKFLIEYGPCYIALPCYGFGPRFWEFSETYYGGHAVTVIGYNSKGFILRNSWGSGWGDGGHTILPYENFGVQWEILGYLSAKPYGPLLEKQGCCNIV